jgi:hypothetical protein
MTIAIISVSIWVLSIIGWIIFNLYNKNKKLESMVINQSEFIYDVKQSMKAFDSLANKIDSQIWVQSDPEFLALFENLKEIQQLAKKYED